MVERSSLLQLFIPENKRNVERFNSWPNEFNDLQHVKSKGSLVTSILNDIQVVFLFLKSQFKIPFKVVYMYTINVTTLWHSGIQWHDMLDSFPFIDIQDFFIRQ